MLVPVRVLSPRRLGAKGGAENVTLTVNQLPSHSHPMTATNSLANNQQPVGRVPASTLGIDAWAEDPDPQNMSTQAITNLGGSRRHTNLMPYLCVNFIIALFGIYPSRQ